MSTFKRLTPARRQFVRMMQAINYGEVRHLAIRDGQPVMEPAPVVVRAVKFGAENGARRETATEDFALKAQVVELFSEFDRLGTGEVERIEVKGGLPFMAMIAG